MSVLPCSTATVPQRIIFALLTIINGGGVNPSGNQTNTYLLPDCFLSLLKHHCIPARCAVMFFIIVLSYILFTKPAIKDNKIREYIHKKYEPKILTAMRSPPANKQNRKLESILRSD
jgi:hypothetical protein